MKLPVQARPCLVPLNYTRYWYDYGRCLACKQEIRHEMHLYNHYRKYHWLFKITVCYFIWYHEFQQWIEVSGNSYRCQKLTKYSPRPTAIARF